MAAAKKTAPKAAKKTAPKAAKKTATKRPKVTRTSLNEYREWYDGQRPTYERLVESAVVTLKGILDSKGIHYVNIYGRAKARKSFFEKIERKTYEDPKTEITDFAGVRVIVYRRSDVARVSKLIEESFGIDPDRSGDKAADLGVDKVGYRSVHFICRFGEKREAFPEFARFSGLVFEVQVRTVLEHAWAEIEHANYKLKTKLPDDLQRELRLVSGSLELVDRQLDTLAKTIDEYSEKVQEEIERGELSAEINGITLLDYVKKRFPDVGLGNWVTYGFMTQELMDELHDFGITDLGGLDALMSDEFLAARGVVGERDTIFGIVRDAMLYNDADRYFAKAWNQHWNGITVETVEFLERRVGAARAHEILRRSGVDRMVDGVPVAF